MPDHPPSTGSPLTDELIRRTLRHARVAWLFAYLGLVLMAIALWYLRSANVAITTLSSQLAQKQENVSSLAREVRRTMNIDFSLPKTIASRAELVAYLQTGGKDVLDRAVPEDEQTAFLAALAPDPAIPGRYVSRYTNAAGKPRIHTFEVFAAVQPVAP